MVFYNRNGRTYVRQANQKPTKVTRTEGQMRNRASWGNLVNLWKSFPEGVKPYFETRRPGANQYNQFLSENLGISPIYLTRGEAANSGGVATPFLVTRGALTGITIRRDSQGTLTDIRMGALVPGPDTTIRQFAHAVIINNDGFLHDDALTYILMRQHTDTIDGRPFVSVTCDSLTLDLTDDTPLRYVVGNSEGFAVRGGWLACNGDPLGGMVWIHSRLVGNNKLHVSSQRMVCNNQTLIDRYSSPEAFDAACQSYGGLTQEPMIKPG